MQKRWSFLDPFGQMHCVGLFHGHDTGHFLMYINDKISVIDFNIKESKSYSIIISRRLLKLSIFKLGEGYEYQLTDETPKPEQPRWEKIRDLSAATIMVGLLFFVLIKVAYSLTSTIF